MSFLEDLRKKGGISKRLYQYVKGIESSISAIESDIDAIETTVGEKSTVAIIGPRTGTGGLETVEHSLGAVPSKVVPVFSSAPDGGVTATLGDISDESIGITVTTSAVYYLILLK